MTIPTSPRLALPLLAAGQAQKEVTHNEALTLIDVTLGACAESAGTDVPPATPSIGQCWIVGLAPTGAWTGKAGALAGWTEGGWRFVPAVEGMRVWLKDRQLQALRQESGWVVGEEPVARVLIEGEQVVGPRQPSVPVPSGGATVDAEARTAIASIIERLSAHGLIDA